MKILIAECIQEISSFNPVPSDYSDFRIERGDEILRQRGTSSSIAGALEVFEACPGVETILSYAANAESAGPLCVAGWAKLRQEFIATVAERLDEADAIYISMHGAMAAEDEMDPEGYLLERIRELAGPAKPIVLSLDLHGILTDRMLRQVNAVVMYHTYPHVDIKDTGARAARLLLKIVTNSLNTTIVSVPIPALVRGDELVTKTGCYGDLLREIRKLECNGTLLAGGIMIGNPFTDVPELGSKVVLVTSGNETAVAAQAVGLADQFWSQRRRMQGKLIALDPAIEQARFINAPVVFTDAADAPSSGATGDSNAIVRALNDAGYGKRVLAQIVDPAAAAQAHQAGVGATINVWLGGALDDRRFEAMRIEATVELLSRGKGEFETWPGGYDAGPTAVLRFRNFTMVVISRPVALVDRSIYYANGIEPENFDLIVVKSPHCEYEMFDAWVEKNFNIDAPGSTSANLPSLGHMHCMRPIFPLDDNFEFRPEAVFFRYKLDYRMS